jgi:hypothetical protein
MFELRRDTNFVQDLIMIDVVSDFGDLQRNLDVLNGIGRPIDISLRTCRDAAANTVLAEFLSCP